MTPNYFIIPGLKKFSTIKEEEAISKVYGVTKEMMYTKTRKGKVVEARQVLMWYYIKFKGFSLHKTGDLFELDHATANHAKNKITDMLEYDSIIKKNVKDFLSLMGRSLNEI